MTIIAAVPIAVAICRLTTFVGVPVLEPVPSVGSFCFTLFEPLSVRERECERECERKSSTFDSDGVIISGGSSTSAATVCGIVEDPVPELRQDANCLFTFVISNTKDPT